MIADVAAPDAGGPLILQGERISRQHQVTGGPGVARSYLCEFDADQDQVTEVQWDNLVEAQEPFRGLPRCLAPDERRRHTRGGQ